MAWLNTIEMGMLTLKTTLVLSIILQLATAILALRLIKIAGGRAAWVLIALALGAMAVRRGITLAGYGWEEGALDQSTSTLVAELVALGTSALLLAGMSIIGPHVAAMRRGEREVRESREVLKATLSACPVGLCLVRQGKLDWANKAMLEMLDFRLDQWMGQPAQILFASQARYEEVNREISRLLGQASRAAAQCQLITRQGKPFEAQIQAQTLDPEQWSRGVVFSVNDVTESLAAQHILAESQEKYRLVVENANDAIFILQSEKIQFPNSRAQEMFGISRDHLEGMTFLALVHTDDRKQLAECLAPVQSGQGRVVNYQHRLVTSGGELRWMDINAAPISWQGRPAALCFVRDLSSQKRLEQQFLQAQKMEAVGRLAGGVAHDFNNMLQVICGYSELIVKGLTPDHPSQEYAKTVLETANRAARLTSRLLTFSRNQPVEIQEIEINQVVVGLEKMLRRLIGEDVTLRSKLRPGLGYVRADPGQMEQVIMNLAVNAKDAMPMGGRLTIDTSIHRVGPQGDPDQPGLAEGDYNLLTISDTGLGMTSEVISHVFEPFFTTKSSNQGTGLGLSTAYGIIKASGGEIAVASEFGKGTQFRIYLPSIQQRTRAAQPEKAENGRLHTGSETVLLVEDEEQVRNLVAETLRLSGYRVLTASDGEEALEVLGEIEGDLHLLITDVIMPHMNGPQLAKQVKKSQPRAKVIFISGYTERTEFISQAADKTGEFLHKPFSASSLTKKVREVLAAG